MESGENKNVKAIREFLTKLFIADRISFNLNEIDIREEMPSNVGPDKIWTITITHKFGYKKPLAKE